MHKKKVASEASRAEVWEGERLVKGPPPFPSPQATDIFFLLLQFLLLSPLHSLVPGYNLHCDKLGAK